MSEEESLSGENDFFAYQDVINRDDSQFGSGFWLPELDQLTPVKHVEEIEGYEAAEDGLSLITGDNHAVWFERTDVDGDVSMFTSEEGNPYAENITSLVRDEGSERTTLTYADGSKSVFYATDNYLDGLLEHREDRLGNILRAYTYTGDGGLESITDLSGKVTYFGHDEGTGLVTSVIDFSSTTGDVTPGTSQTTVLGYDMTGHLASVTQPDPDGGGVLSSPVTTYSYYTDARAKIC